MYKLDLEKAEEREIRLPTLDHRKSKGIPEKKKSTAVSLTTLKPLYESL